MLNHRAAVDRVFHALGDPTRRAIVERLSRGAVSMSELAKPLDITLAAVVQHIQLLQDSGLVSTNKVGRVRQCRIDPAGLQLAEQWIADRRATWQQRFDRLEQLLLPDEGEQDSPPKQQAPRKKDRP